MSFFDANAPTFAIGTRKLGAAYAGSCLRVSVGPTDIGFSGSDFDTAAMVAVVGAGAGNVSIFYDQSGNVRDMTTGGGAPGTVRTGGVTQVIGSRTVMLATAGEALNHAVVTLASLMTANAATILWLGLPVTITTNNTTDPTINNAAFADGFAIVGGTFRSAGFVQSFNDDNVMDFTEQAVSLTAPIAMAWRHNGGNVEMQVNGGAWTTVASGNTRALTGKLAVGRSAAGVIKTAELATFNTALTDAQVNEWGREATSYYGVTWGATALDWTAVQRTLDRLPYDGPADRYRHLRTPKREEV